jgi:hypothetical protein
MPDQMNAHIMSLPRLRHLAVRTRLAQETQRRQQGGENHRQQQDRDSGFANVVDLLGIPSGVDGFACLSRYPRHDVREAGTDIEKDAGRR